MADAAPAATVAVTGPPLLALESVRVEAGGLPILREL
jgi:hypothetical protein